MSLKNEVSRVFNFKQGIVLQGDPKKTHGSIPRIMDFPNGGDHYSRHRSVDLFRVTLCTEDGIPSNGDDNTINIFIADKKLRFFNFKQDDALYR